MRCSVNALISRESDESNVRAIMRRKTQRPDHGRLRDGISFRGKRYISRADSYGRWSMRVTDARLIFLCSRLQRHGFPLLCRNAIAGSCLCRRAFDQETSVSRGKPGLCRYWFLKRYLPVRASFSRAFAEARIKRPRWFIIRVRRPEAPIPLNSDDHITSDSLVLVCTSCGIVPISRDCILD